MLAVLASSATVIVSRFARRSFDVAPLSPSRGSPLSIWEPPLVRVPWFPSKKSQSNGVTCVQIPEVQQVLFGRDDDAGSFAHPGLRGRSRQHHPLRPGLDQIRSFEDFHGLSGENPRCRLKIKLGRVGS